jgi:hypothetical protein
MGDFLLSVASPETLSWMGFMVLAAALVGEAAVAIIPARWELLHKELAFGFAVLAASGYAVERLGDDAILRGLEARAAAAEQQLKTFVARDLSVEQERISTAVTPFSGQKYEVAIPQGIDDGFSFWKTLHSTLSGAGWEYVPPYSNSLWVKVGDAPPVSTTMVSVPGVTIFIDPAKLKDLDSVAIALGNALLKEGIKTGANVSSYHNDDETKQKTLQIVIGVRAKP